MSDEDFEFLADARYQEVMTEEAVYVGEIVTVGESNKADGDTIAHGLLAEPDHVFLTPSAPNRIIGYSAKDSTGITVALKEFSYGLAEATNGSVSVTHGLSQTPGLVLCTPKTADRSVRVTSVGATTFTIELLEASTGDSLTGTEDVYWLALCAVDVAEAVQWMAMGDRQQARL